MATFPQRPDEEFRAYFYDRVATIGKALSSAPRLVLMNTLCQGDRSVDVLARVVGLTSANTSRHLQALKRAQLVTDRRHGNRVVYRVSSDDVVRFFLRLKNLAADQLPELRHAIAHVAASPSRVDPVEREELVQLVESGASPLIDVRPREEFAHGHIPRAISIPLDELQSRVEELPRDAVIVVLCRGPYCVLADQAVSVLQAAGLTARRAQDGVVEWRLAGLMLEQEDGGPE